MGSQCLHNRRLFAFNLEYCLYEKKLPLKYVAFNMFDDRGGLKIIVGVQFLTYVNLSWATQQRTDLLIASLKGAISSYLLLQFQRA